MRFSRIIIFVLIGSFLLQPLTPAIVQAAQTETSGQGNKTGQHKPLPPFPEDKEQMPIDWSQVDWDKEAILPKDQEEFNARLRELEARGRYAEVSQLKLKKRLWSDNEVMAHYQAPQEVQELVRGYRLNAKNASTPKHRAALKSLLSERIKTILLIQNYYPLDFNFDNNSQEQPDQNQINVNKTAPLKPRRINGVQKPDGNNIQFKIKSLLQNPSNAHWWEGKIKKPGKKVSWTERLLALIATPANAYYQPTTPIIEYYEGIEKNPIDNALYYLSQTQNEDGSWGDYSQYELTAWLTFILSQYNKTENDQYALAINYLKNTALKNNREKAIKAWVLISLGESYQALLDDLLTRQNPNGGYGLEDNYASDVITTLEVLAAFWKADNTLLPASLSYVLAQIQTDGSMRYASAAVPSYYLMNKTAEYLQPFGQVSQTTQDKLDLLTNYLAGRYDLEQESLANTNDVIDELMTLQTLKSYGLSPDKQASLTEKVKYQQAGNGSFGNTLHAQLAAFKALAQSDLIITNLQSTSSLVNGQAASFEVTIKNIGYLPSGNFKLYNFVDGFKINDGYTFNSLPPAGQATVTVNFDTILTRQIIGDTEIKFYVEAGNEFNYDNNWKTANFTFAANASGLPAMPLYHIEQQFSIDGIPALNIRYPRKNDPNRVNFVAGFRPAGTAEWQYYGIREDWNGAFLYPFAEGSVWEVTAGVLHNDLQTVTLLNDFTTITMSGNDALNTATVNGRVTIDASPAANISTFGYSVSGVADPDGNITYQNVRHGNSASGVNDSSYRQYDRLLTKFLTPKNGITNNVRLFSHLRADAAAPVISSLEIRWAANFIVKNQQTADLLVSVADNIITKETDFYYYDPAQSVWLYLGTEPVNSGQAWLQWYIPDTLLGAGYKVRAIARDYRANESTPVEWGPFQIVNGAPPGGSITVEGLTDNQWRLGETKNITWTSSGANAIATISSAWLYYAPTSSNYLGGNFHTAQGSISYTMPLVAGYAVPSAFVRMNVCDINNNCTQIQSDLFAIVDPSPPPPLPWGVPQVVDGISSVSGIDRYVQQVFENADGSVEIIYTEYDGQYYTDPGQYIRIVYRQLLNGVWQTPIVLKEHLYRDGVTSGVNFRPIQAVKASNGDIHIAYTRGTSSSDWRTDLDGREVYYLHLSGSAVVSDRNISAGAVYSDDPHLAVNEQNRVFITWRAGYSYVASSGTSTLRYVEGDGASSWTSPAAITSEPTSGYALALEQGAPVAVYQSNSQLNFIRRSGGDWSPAIAANEPASGISEMSLFSRGSNLFDLIYMFGNDTTSWRRSVRYLKLSVDWTGSTSLVLQKRIVVEQAGTEDLRYYIVLPREQGQYHVIYIKQLPGDGGSHVGYLYFDQNGPHFNNYISPALMNVDEYTLFGSEKAGVVTAYFSGYIGGTVKLLYNRADLSGLLAQLPPAPVLPPPITQSGSLRVAAGSLKPGQASRYNIYFTPSKNIASPGSLKIIFPKEFDLSLAAATNDISVSGGGVAWNTYQDGDLDYANNVLKLSWSSGVLTPGLMSTIFIGAVKNPAQNGNYSISAAVGSHNFTIASDTQNASLNIDSGLISIGASVPYQLTNPAISNIAPVETIIMASGSSQPISLVLADVNNDAITYSLTPSSGSISVAPEPASPVSNTQNGVSVNFTYYANGALGPQTITVTADDNEPVGGGLVVYNIQLFIF